GATVTKSQGTGTIQNDDSPELSINNVQMSEGNSGTTTFTFTVSLSPASNQTVTVNYATADGTATTAGNDYQQKSGTLTFNPGDTQKPINVLVNGDTLVEADETFVVNLTLASGANISTGQGTGTILNDDTPLVVISQVYGGGGNTSATYKNDFVEIFNRGTATVDLAGWSVQATSATGTSWAVTPLCPTGSCLLAPGKYFLVQEASSGAVGSNLPAADATGTIGLSATAAKVALVNNSTALTTSGCPFTANIMDFVGYGTTADCFEGSNRAPAPSNTTADFRKSGGCVDTNDNSADFVAATPIPRNSSSAANDCSTGFRPDITINDVTVAEGNTATTAATFTVTLSAANDTQAVTVDYSTADGTATAGSDYQQTSGTLTFNPGETTKTIPVNVIGDTTNEPNETFFVNLSNPTNAAILDNQGQGTITDDDVQPSLSINDVSQNEGNSGTTNFVFNVTLSAPSGFTVTVDYATADGTATTAGNDYQQTSGTLTFNPGDTQKTITVLVNGDTTFEPDETFFVNLSNATHATISKSQGTGTIKNDEPAADLSISKNASSSVAVAGGTINYAILLTNNGPDAATSPTLSDTIPANTTFQSLSSPVGWNCTNPSVGGTGTINCSSASSLANAATASFSLTLNVVNGTGVGTVIGNTATCATSASDPNQNNNSSTASVTVVAAGSADLAITKTDSPDPVAIGNNITYTITANNNGPATASSVQVTDAMPSGTTFKALSSPAGWSCTTPSVGGTGSVTCTIASLASGASAVFQLTVKVNSSVTDESTISNTASISSSTTDSIPGNNSATQTTTVKAPLIVISQVYGGGGNTSAPFKNDFIEIYNRGATTVDLAGWSVQVASATSTSWTATPICPTGSCLIAPGKYFLVQEASGGAVGNSLPTPDATGTINLSATAAKVALVNNSTALTTSGCPFTANIMDFVGYGTTADCFEGSNRAPAPSNTTADLRKNNGCTDTNNNAADFATGTPNPRNSASTANSCSSDLSITKTSASGIVQAGNDISYTITATNSNSTDGPTNTTVTDAIPANTTFKLMGAPPAGWTCITPSVGATGTITCTNSSNFTSAAFTLTVTVNGGTAPGTVITNTATIANDLTDPNNNNNSSTSTVTVVTSTSADVAITQTDSPDPVTSGNNITYTITASNNGPATASNVQVSGSTPAGTTFQSLGVPAGWTCITPTINGTGTITCNPTSTTLASGASTVFTLTVKVNNAVSSGTIISNTVNISTSTTDFVTGNNSATEKTTVN
ncbi:MAG: hypothetical protein DMF68_21205, partial [Acidobacteria bacterium]